MSGKRDSSEPRGLAALAKLRDQLPAGPEAPSGPAVPLAKIPARAVVRVERKQRGGKEVTVVDKLELEGDELARWCKELKQALGCGGSVEDVTIMLQGDLRKRVAELLTARGIKRVTVS